MYDLPSINLSFGDLALLVWIDNGVLASIEGEPVTEASGEADFHHGRLGRRASPPLLHRPLDVFGWCCALATVKGAETSIIM